MTSFARRQNSRFSRKPLIPPNAPPMKTRKPLIPPIGSNTRVACARAHKKVLKSLGVLGGIRGEAVETTRCPRCRSTETVDFHIHNRASVRRDCWKCGRFIEFVSWYGEHAPEGQP
jgi:hypothetical protein